MDKSNLISAYETSFCVTSGGDAQVEFNDDSTLILIPYRNWGNIEGFNTALLYRARSLEALATDRLYRYSTDEESGFWSKGNITQQQLEQYWKIARQIGEQKFESYKEKKIDERTWLNNFWGFWKITSEGHNTIIALQEGTLRVFETKPSKWNDQI